MLEGQCDVMCGWPRRDQLTLGQLDCESGRAEGSNSGDGCRITEFHMARSDDAAECQQLQGGSFLLHALFAHLHVMDQGREDVHRVFLLVMKMRDDFHIQNI